MIKNKFQNLNFIEGNFLSSQEQYLLNACHTYGAWTYNQVTKKIFEKFTYADILFDPTKGQQTQIEFLAEISEFNCKKLKRLQDIGSISIMGNGNNERFIINLFCQKVNGEPLIIGDDEIRRKRFFISCMNKVYKIPEIQNFALSENFVGAKFKKDYLRILDIYGKKYPHVKIFVYIKEKILKQETLQH